MKYCQNCRQELEDSASVCPNCGVTAESAPTEKAEAAQPEAAPFPSAFSSIPKKKRRKTGIAVLCAAIAVILIAAAALSFTVFRDDIELAVKGKNEYAASSISKLLAASPSAPSSSAPQTGESKTSLSFAISDYEKLLQTLSAEEREQAEAVIALLNTLRGECSAKIDAAGSSSYLQILSNSDVLIAVCTQISGSEMLMNFPGIFERGLVTKSETASVPSANELSKLIPDTKLLKQTADKLTEKLIECIKKDAQVDIANAAVNGDSVSFTGRKITVTFTPQVLGQLVVSMLEMLRSDDAFNEELLRLYNILFEISGKKISIVTADMLDRAYNEAILAISGTDYSALPALEHRSVSLSLSLYQDSMGCNRAYTATLSANDGSQLTLQSITQGSKTETILAMESLFRIKYTTEEKSASEAVSALTVSAGGKSLSFSLEQTEQKAQKWNDCDIQTGKNVLTIEGLDRLIPDNDGSVKIPARITVETAVSLEGETLNMTGSLRLPDIITISVNASSENNAGSIPEINRENAFVPDENTTAEQYAEYQQALASAMQEHITKLLQSNEPLARLILLLSSAVM